MALSAKRFVAITPTLSRAICYTSASASQVNCVLFVMIPDCCSLQHHPFSYSCLASLDRAFLCRLSSVHSVLHVRLWT